MQPPLPSQRRGKGEGFSSRFICVNPSPQSSPPQEERRSGRAIEISAGLLAGGESRRMGKDKAMLPFGGKPLWQIQLELLGKLEPVEIFVSARTDPAWRLRDVHFVADDSPSRGPLSGLAAALPRMHTKHLLALAIDMPFMTEKYLRFLCSQIEPGRGCRIGSAAFWDRDEIVNLAGRGLVFFASGMRIRRQQRRESFALRHDAAGLCRDET